MISCHDFYNALTEAKLNFYAGVPDSLLKNFCYLVADSLPSDKHVITANEGSAVGLAAGYHMATGNIPCVYLQNSGLGNTINPLLSIADKAVYSIPMLLIVGWRGEPGVKDEPQHVKQGQVMLGMLESMGLPYEIIDPQSDFKAQIARAVKVMKETSAPFVFAVREGTFDDYKLKNKVVNNYTMTREEAISLVMDLTGAQDAVVATTGKASRELYELRIKREESGRADFLTVGAMGHCSQIALGVALGAPQKRVFCIDGDGAMLMHLGGAATIARLAPKNYYHIMLNNGAHESVGGQESGAFNTNWQQLALSVGYKKAFLVTTSEEAKRVLSQVTETAGPVFVELRVSAASRKDLGRPKSTPIENKQQFMKAFGR